MHIVDTASPQATLVARTEDGKVDLDAYIGLNAAYKATDNLTVGVVIKDARTRFGHLDLLVSPRDGMGKQWVERKNLTIALDPAKPAPTPTLGHPTVTDALDDETGTVVPDIPAPVVEPVEETQTNLADEVRAIINRATIK